MPGRDHTLAATRFLPWLLLTLAASTLLSGLGRRDIWTAAEGRPPLLAREILRTGHIQPPYANGRPYLNKPPLYHLLVAATFAISGGESTAAARLPAALAAILCVLLTYLMAADLAGPLAGAAAGFFLLLSVRFFTLGRSAELETLLTASLSLSYLGLTRALDDPEHALRHGLLGAAGAFLACLTKGPILALLFPALLLVARACSEKSTKPLRGRGPLLLLLGVVAATGLYYGPLLINSTYRAALFQRAQFENVRHVRGLFYYLPQVLAGLLPALVFLPLGFKGGALRWRPTKPFLLAFLLGLLLLSLSKSKQSHYLLPLYPLLAVWAGPGIARGLQYGRRRFLLPPLLLLAVGIPIAVIRWDDVTPFVDEHSWVWGASLSVAFLALISASLVWRRARESRRPRVGADETFLVALTLLAALAVGASLVGAYRNPHQSGRQAMALFREASGGAQLASLQRKPSDLFYLDRPDATLPDSPLAGQRFLKEHPLGYLILRLGRGEKRPKELLGIHLQESWRSPHGRSRYLLLGPGEHR